MEVHAKLRHLHIAPRKVRLTASLIRGLSYRDAMAQLRHLPKRASRPLEKLLQSAAANARHNFSLDEKNLRVKEVLVDGGPVIRRIEPRAFGRGAVVRKRMSHVLVTLDELAARPASKTGMRKSKPEVRRARPEEVEAIREGDEGKKGVEIRESRGAVKARPGAPRRVFKRPAA